MSQQQLNNIQMNAYSFMILLMIFCTGGWSFAIAAILFGYILEPFLEKTLNKHPIVLFLAEILILTMLIISAILVKII